MSRPVGASVCGRPIFKKLNRELHDFAQEIRGAVRHAVEICGVANIVDEDAQVVGTWAITLGPLMHDVSGAALLLLSHGHRRAPVMLNRSLFEYQLRLRYYALKPDKARQAIAQTKERFRKIMRADPTWTTGRSKENCFETEQWLDKKDAFERENIRNDVFQTVYGDDATLYYDGYYGKASALVHGYETILRDVHRDMYVGEENPQPDFKGKVWEPNDTCAVLVHHLFDGLAAIVSIAGNKDNLAVLKQRWTAMQMKLVARGIILG